jgi:hypothetical protein
VKRDDVFDGDVEFRLRRVSSRLRAAAFDAQVRDWVAERPDRVGFARLAQAHWTVGEAAARYGRGFPPNLALQFGAPLAGIAAGLTILLTATHPAGLPALLLSIVTASLVTQFVVAATFGVRKRRAERARPEPATIDDPYFRADVTRRLEACAAAAQADRAAPHRAAAQEIKAALTWFSFTQGER